MIAYHGKPEIKELYLARVRAHADADEIIHGKYWENGKGCAVGCTIHGSNHAEYEVQLGIPADIAQLEDAIFESLPDEDSKTFPLRFLVAIPVGADLSLVVPHFIYWMLTSDVRPTRYPQFQPYIDAVFAFYEEWTRTGVRPSDRAVLDFITVRRAVRLAVLADRAYLAVRADRAYLAVRRADLAYLAVLADLAYLAVRRADRAYLAVLADLAYLADRQEASSKLIQLLSEAPILKKEAQ